MNRTKITRALGATVLAAALTLTVSACGDDTRAKVGDAVSNATDKAGEAASDATRKAGDAAAAATAKAGDAAASASAKAKEAGERAKGAYASASAEAAAKLNEVKGGADAGAEVTVGGVKAEGDRSTAQVTAANQQRKEQSYTVQVNFRDAGGNLLDAVVVNLKDVAAGQNATATARSNRALQGEVTAEAGKSLRH